MTRIIDIYTQSTCPMLTRHSINDISELRFSGATSKNEAERFHCDQHIYFAIEGVIQQNNSEGDS